MNYKPVEKAIVQWRSIRKENGVADAGEKKQHQKIYCEGVCGVITLILAISGGVISHASSHLFSSLSEEAVSRQYISFM
jgi:hypothetical protein